MQQLSELIERRLPRRPYCSDNLEHGLIIRPSKIAVSKNYLQLNPPCHRHWLLFDLDRPMAALAWEQAHLPPPNWIAINPANGHAHLGYLLEVPVVTSEAGRDKPLRYAAAVEKAFRIALGADPGYAGLIAKNPLSEHWKICFLHTQAFDLNYLAEWVTLTSAATPCIEPIGLGRNIMLFDSIRQWSYRNVLLYKETNAGLEQWFRTVMRECELVNQHFPTPMTLSEVRGIAKSIAKWTWREFSEKAFSQIQRERAHKRWANRSAPSIEQSKPWESMGISRSTYYDHKKVGLLSGSD